MYRYRLNDVPKWYFACTEVVLQKNTCTENDLICTEVVMYQNCPPLCTEAVMYRKRPNPTDIHAYIHSDKHTDRHCHLTSAETVIGRSNYSDLEMYFSAHTV